MPGFELIGKEEKKALNDIFDEGGIFFAHGFDKLRKKFHVREFEKAASKYFKVKQSLAVSSGTAAIKIGLKALGVKPGDEVITQAFNFIATIEAILDLGAKPIICNIDKSLNMDVFEIKKLITPKTKVILPVHMLGVPADIKSIMQIAKKNKIKVLEDNCESVGVKYHNKYLGTFGDAGVFSFDFGKTITTGEGGMIISNNLEIMKYCREYHDHGHENNPKLPRGKDSKSIYGFNYRMTELQAAIGKVQLKKLNYIIKENKKRYNILDKNLDKNIEKRFITKNSQDICDTFIIKIHNKKLRENIITLLKDFKFGTKNLPDALDWHCTYFWDHALTKKEISKSKKTKDLLEQMIAIPILLRKKPSQYKELVLKLNKISRQD